MTLALPTPSAPLRIGTRGSPLALAQAEETRARLMAVFALPAAAFEIVVIRTTGDRVQDRSLAAIGGKGLFTREIEDDLAAGGIDIAVHSMKDMPTAPPPGLVIDCVLPREDVRDAVVGPAAAGLGALAPGSIVGTSSLRRRAQILNRHPLLKVVEFRGNVQTRLRKLAEGVAQATLLAMAGLNRLGLAHLAAGVLDPAAMLPAVAQGAIGVERRADDRRTAGLLAAIHDRDSGIRLAAERAMLAGLDGSCRTPIAGLAVIEGGSVWLRGEVLRPDGSEAVADEGRAPLADAAALGAELAQRLLRRVPAGFFALPEPPDGG